jgi:protease-4
MLRPRRPAIGVLTLSETITDCTAAGVFQLLRKFLSGRQRVAGLVVRLSSSGGSLGAAQATVDCLEQFIAETRVPVAIAIDNLATSAAFYIAASFRPIFAQPAAVVGSVGAQIVRYDVTALMDRLGVRDVTVASSPAKGHFERLLTQYPAAGGSEAYPSAWGGAANGGTVDDRVASLVRDVHEQFVSRLTERRGAAALTPDVLDGRLITGRRAAEIGLIDGLGGTRQAIEAVAQSVSVSDFELVELSIGQGPGLLAMLLSSFPLGRRLLPFLEGGS